MTKTVYGTNRDVLILTRIKIVSTENFAPDTEHVSFPSTQNASWLRPLP